MLDDVLVGNFFAWSERRLDDAAHESVLTPQFRFSRQAVGKHREEAAVLEVVRQRSALEDESRHFT